MYPAVDSRSFSLKEKLNRTLWKSTECTRLPDCDNCDNCEELALTVRQPIKGSKTVVLDGLCKKKLVDPVYIRALTKFRRFEF